jgi:hypothetical protein
MSKISGAGALAAPTTLVVGSAVHGALPAKEPLGVLHAGATTVIALHYTAGQREKNSQRERQAQQTGLVSHRSASRSSPRTCTPSRRDSPRRRGPARRSASCSRQRMEGRREWRGEGNDFLALVDCGDHLPLRVSVQP